MHPHWGAISAGLLATAGAALLNDLDHPEGTAAYSFGPVSKLVARILHRVSGGHRHATHSLLFCALAPLLTWFADATLGRPFEIGMLFVLYTFAARALRLAPGASSSLGVVTAVATWYLLPDLSWLPWSVAAGCLAHVAGDCLTNVGCPVFWPYRRHFTLPLIEHTGNWLETRLVAPAFAIGAVVLLVFGR